MNKIQSKFLVLLVMALILIGFDLNELRSPVFAQDMRLVSPISNLGPDPSTSMNFTWHMGVSAKTPLLEYSPAGTGFSFETAKTIKVLARSVVTKTDADVRQICRVELRDLTPGTVYDYRILADGVIVSSSGTFRTAGGASEPYSFIQITDTQGFTAKHYELWASTFHQARNQFPESRFLLHTGDFVDRGHLIWQWDQFAASAREDLMKIPLVPVVGNHETTDKDGSNPKAKNFLERFSTPQIQNAGAVSGTVYSFDYGAAHIAVMNTECGKDSFSKQADWLRKDMAATQKQWRIVALHRSPYGALNNTIDIRNAWVPVFDEMKIDVVLGGHDHSYVRSSMKSGKQVKTGEGTTYIVANSGGVKFYPGKARSWQVANFQNYRQMYLGITVDPSTLTIKAFDVRNMLMDEVTLLK